ncbi:TPA: hypothetical protein L5Q43_003177 [Pseudomonas aeruginosa]|nr:hypothetical protein [Pseudomonas aeruginosa]
MEDVELGQATARGIVEPEAFDAVARAVGEGVPLAAALPKPWKLRTTIRRARSSGSDVSA